MTANLFYIYGLYCVTYLITAGFRYFSTEFK